MKVKKVVDQNKRLFVRSSSATSVDSEASSIPVEQGVSSCQKDETEPAVAVETATENIVPNKPTKSSTPAVGATTTTNKPKKKACHKKKKRQRVVRFEEEPAIWCPDDSNGTTITLDKKERKALWYSHKETQAFKDSTMSLVKRIVNREEAANDPAGWLLSLRAAYGTFCEPNVEVATVEQVMREQQQLPIIKASTWGMEKWAVRNMASDRIERRRRLWQCIADLQQQQREELSEQSPRQKAHAIRLASREITRPSRLFAHHAAQLGISKKKTKAKSKKIKGSVGGRTVGGLEGSRGC